MLAHRVELIFTGEWTKPRPLAVPRPMRQPPATLQEALATCDHQSLASYLHVLGCSPQQILTAIEDPTGYGFQLITALRPTAIA